MAPNRNIPTVLEFRGRSFIIWEDVDNKFLRACLAEFMAMNLFVLLCCGCAMVTLNLPNPNLMMVAASFGFGILVLAQIFGPLSGGHINCAVSFGLFIAGRTSLIKTLCFTMSQMLGSIFGALFLWAIFGSHWPAARAFGSNSWDESVFTAGQVFFAEMLGTMILMFNVLSTIDIPTGDGGPLAVFPIAMSVMIAHLFLLPIDGCSINPSRSFGPSVVATWANIEGNFSHQQYIFWLGPMFGAGLAAAIYEYASLKPENFAGARDMTQQFSRSVISHTLVTFFCSAGICWLYGLCRPHLFCINFIPCNSCSHSLRLARNERSKRRQFTWRHKRWHEKILQSWQAQIM